MKFVFNKIKITENRRTQLFSNFFLSATSKSNFIHAFFLWALNITSYACIYIPFTTPYSFHLLHASHSVLSWRPLIFIPKTIPVVRVALFIILKRANGNMTNMRPKCRQCHAVVLFVKTKASSQGFKGMHLSENELIKIDLLC